MQIVKFPSTSYKAHICPPLPIHIWPLVSFSELLESFSVVSHIPSSNLHTPGFFNIWFHQSLITKASKILIHTSLFFFKPISQQTASHATVLILPQQFSTLSCTACNSITKKPITAQCSNTEFRTRSIILQLNVVNEVDIGYTSKRIFCLLSRFVLQCE